MPYREDDLATPISVYGTSKLAGENLVRAYCPRHFVIRTTGLYGVAGASGKGGNFVETMIRLGKAGPVRVVRRSGDDADRHRRSGRRRRRAARRARASRPCAYGLYHVTSAGQCSWYDFAKTHLRAVQDGRRSLADHHRASLARRRGGPAFSVLATASGCTAGFPELRPWREALSDYLRAKGHV